jgi:uncharacterized lipoprotein YmbA
MRSLAALSLAVVLAGCAVSDTTRYYALGAAQPPAPPKQPATTPGLTIGVGPVTIPGYLDRPQLVTRDAAGELEIWPYHRWAEALDTGIASALAEAISARSGNDRVAVFPWRGPFARALDYQVVVAVARFEGSPERTVTLDARWGVVTRDGREVAFKRTTLTEPIGGTSFPAVVAAMNRSIGRLAAEVAEAIQALPANRAEVRP